MQDAYIKLNISPNSEQDIADTRALLVDVLAQGVADGAECKICEGPEVSFIISGVDTLPALNEVTNNVVDRLKAALGDSVEITGVSSLGLKPDSERQSETPNIRAWYERTKAAEEQAFAEKEGIMKYLISLIPPELAILKRGIFSLPTKEQVAEDQRYRSLLEDRIDWIRIVCDETQKGLHVEKKFRRNELGDYGFESLEDAFNKLQLLKKAWKGLVDVEVEKAEDMVLIYCRMSE